MASNRSPLTWPRQYPDGTVLLERAEVTLPRTYARRQVLLIAKFRRCNAWGACGPRARVFGEARAQRRGATQ